MAIKKRRNIDFYGMIQKGENPNGMTAQTANGTAHATSTGWNRNEPYSFPEIEPRGPWQKPHSNRSGE